MTSSKISAVVVDDSNFMVTILTDILEENEQIEVVGTGGNGEEAIELNREKDPDVILMDIEMPVMDGLTAVKKIMSDNPTPVVIVSAMEDKKTGMSVKALEAGAVDFIPKTSGSLSMDIRKKSDEITQKVINAGKTDMESLELEKGKPIEKEFVPEKFKDNIITIASSTGGTRALDSLLSNLPSNFPVPIVVVQHMPPDFTEYLASTLNSKLELPVREAKDHDNIEPNNIYIIPSDYHGMVREWNEEKSIVLKKKPKLHGVRPSADYLFQSAAEVYRDKVIGVVLTGMGKDGATGAKIVKDNDGFLALQDEESSVVYGMPKSAKNKTTPDFEGTPSEIGKKLVDMFMEEK